MRYIADTEGYVKQVSFGADIVCADQECSEYTGSAPSGYKDLEDWFFSEMEKLYRWKIVDGQLTLDSTAVAPSTPTLKELLARLGIPQIIEVWVNPDPADEFTTGKVEFDEAIGLSDLVQVCFRQSVTVNREVWQQGRVGAQSLVTVAGRLQYTSGDYALALTRPFTVETSGVTFAAATYASSTSAANNTPAALIPQAIYVVKNVKSLGEDTGGDPGDELAFILGLSKLGAGILG